MNDIQSDKDVEVLVHDFYSKVQVNDRPGYIFNDVAKVDWDDHLPKMVSFWSNFLFKRAGTRGALFGSICPFLLRKVILIYGIDYLRKRWTNFI